MTELAVGVQVGLQVGVQGAVRVRVAEDEQAQFSAFYRDTWPDVHAFAATLLRGDRVAAEEIAQESMARVFSRWQRLRDPRPYAFTVATNLVRRRWHELQRTRPADPSALTERAARTDFDHTADAVRRLPDHLRRAVLLHYYADLPLEAVASAVGRPLGTVKRWLHEARHHLSLALEDAR